MSKPRVISLFSGAGGLDYGFEAAGFQTAIAVERDATCCATLRANRAWPVIEGDILNVTTSEILKRGQLRVGDGDVLIGGPPCQPFSKAGYWARGDSSRLADPRASTLGAYLRVIEEAQPKVFVLENVEGLAYQGKDEGLSMLLSAIERINKRTKSHYRPKFEVVDAAAFGVPQFRRRFIMVASRDGSEFAFPAGTHGDPNELPAGAESYRTVWDAIGDVAPTSDEDLRVTGKWADLLPSIPEGRNYSFHTDRGGGRELFGWRRWYWSFLLKLAKALPSWTIPAQPGSATGPFHWENRRLSMRELCRLQTFPDDVSVAGSRVAVQRQLGNAVPSLLAEVVAREIRCQLLGLSRIRRAPRLLPTPRSPVPPPEATGDVPRKYRHLEGDHAAHPGTGQGKFAIRRRMEEPVLESSKL